MEIRGEYSPDGRILFSKDMLTKMGRQAGEKIVIDEIEAIDREVEVPSTGVLNSYLAEGVSPLQR